MPQASQRSPKERGKEGGRGFVAARFDCIVERRFRDLLRLWEDDKDVVVGSMICLSEIQSLGILFGKSLLGVFSTTKLWT